MTTLLARECGGYTYKGNIRQAKAERRVVQHYSNGISTILRQDSFDKSPNLTTAFPFEGRDKQFFYKSAQTKISALCPSRCASFFFLFQLLLGTFFYCPYFLPGLLKFLMLKERTTLLKRYAEAYAVYFYTIYLYLLGVLRLNRKIVLFKKYVRNLNVVSIVKKKSILIFITFTGNFYTRYPRGLLPNGVLVYGFPFLIFLFRSLIIKRNDNFNSSTFTCQVDCNVLCHLVVVSILFWFWTFYIIPNGAEKISEEIKQNPFIEREKAL